MALCDHRCARAAGYQHFSAMLDRVPDSLLRIGDPYDIEHDVLVLDQTRLAQALPECIDQRPIIGAGRRTKEQESKPGRFLELLRKSHTRPGHRATNQRNELPSSHYTTTE